MLFDPAIAMMEKALDVAAVRQQAVALNVANVNTPGYKRTEVAFPTVLADIMNEYRSQQAQPPAMPDQASAARMLPMEVAFLKANLAFDHSWSPEAPPALGSTAAAATAKLNAVQPEIEVIDHGNMRFDGNNVNIDASIADMVKNNVGYGNITGILASDFKLIKAVIEAR